MSEAELSLLSVVVGALSAIGGTLISSGFNLFQSKGQERREAIKLAAEASSRDERCVLRF
jgi:hypothetical protein